MCIRDRLKQVIETNRANLEQEKQDFSQKCIQSAGMAAYFVEHSPEVKGSLSKTRELAEQLRVDEIHFFTPEGEIYAGTHPKLSLIHISMQAQEPYRRFMT